MNKQEFENRATRPISDSDYKTLEYVYTYHPCIDENRGKDQIAKLYSEFGMRIIEDMLPTARRAEELEEAINHVRGELTMLKAKYDALKNG